MTDLKISLHRIEIILTKEQSVFSHTALKINTPFVGLKVSTLVHVRYQFILAKRLPHGGSK